MEEVVYGRKEDAVGDRPETSEAQGQRVPLTSPENRPRQKHLNPQKSVRDLGMNPQSQECDGRSRDAPDGTSWPLVRPGWRRGHSPQGTWLWLGSFRSLCDFPQP